MDRGTQRVKCLLQFMSVLPWPTALHLSGEEGVLPQPSWSSPLPLQVCLSSLFSPQVLCLWEVRSTCNGAVLLGHSTAVCQVVLQVLPDRQAATCFLARGSALIAMLTQGTRPFLPFFPHAFCSSTGGLGPCSYHSYHMLSVAG